MLFAKRSLRFSPNSTHFPCALTVSYIALPLLQATKMSLVLPTGLLLEAKKIINGEYHNLYIVKKEEDGPIDIVVTHAGLNHGHEHDAHTSKTWWSDDQKKDAAEYKLQTNEGDIMELLEDFDEEEKQEMDLEQILDVLFMAIYFDRMTDRLKIRKKDRKKEHEMLMKLKQDAIDAQNAVVEREKKKKKEREEKRKKRFAQDYAREQEEAKKYLIAQVEYGRKLIAAEEKKSAAFNHAKEVKEEKEKEMNKMHLNLPEGHLYDGTRDVKSTHGGVQSGTMSIDKTHDGKIHIKFEDKGKGKQLFELAKTDDELVKELGLNEETLGELGMQELLNLFSHLATEVDEDTGAVRLKPVSAEQVAEAKSKIRRIKSKGARDPEPSKIAEKRTQKEGAKKGTQREGAKKQSQREGVKKQSQREGAKQGTQRKGAKQQAQKPSQKEKLKKRVQKKDEVSEKKAFLQEKIVLDAVKYNVDIHRSPSCLRLTATDTFGVRISCEYDWKDLLAEMGIQADQFDSPESLAQEVLCHTGVYLKSRIKPDGKKHRVRAVKISRKRNNLVRNEGNGYLEVKKITKQSKYSTKEQTEKRKKLKNYKKAVDEEKKPYEAETSISGRKYKLAMKLIPGKTVRVITEAEDTRTGLIIKSQINVERILQKLPIEKQHYQTPEDLFQTIIPLINLQHGNIIFTQPKRKKRRKGKQKLKEKRGVGNPRRSAEKMTTVTEGRRPRSDVEEAEVADNQSTEAQKTQRTPRAEVNADGGEEEEEEEGEEEEEEANDIPPIADVENGLEKTPSPRVSAQVKIGEGITPEKRTPHFLEPLENREFSKFMLSERTMKRGGKKPKKRTPKKVWSEQSPDDEIKVNMWNDVDQDIAAPINEAPVEIFPLMMNCSGVMKVPLSMVPEIAKSQVCLKRAKIVYDRDSIEIDRRQIQTPPLMKNAPEPRLLNMFNYTKLKILEKRVITDFGNEFELAIKVNKWGSPSKRVSKGRPGYRSVVKTSPTLVQKKKNESNSNQLGKRRSNSLPFSPFRKSQTVKRLSSIKLTTGRLPAHSLGHDRAR